MKASSGEQPPAGKKEKRFHCDHCGRSFARLEHLQRHERIRDDLLVRHERLTHQKPGPNIDQPQPADHYMPQETRPLKRMRTSFDAGRPVPTIPSMMNTPAATAHMDMQPPLHPHPAQIGPTHYNETDEFSLNALSMAAEYQSLQGTQENVPNGDVRHHHLQNFISQTVEQHVLPSPTVHMSDPSISGAGLGESLDSLAAFLDNEPLTSYRLSSLINTEQPMPFFSPDSLGYGNEFLAHAGTPLASTLAPQTQADNTHTFSRFGSRLPSLQPEDFSRHNGRRSFSDISLDDRQKMVEKLKEFSSVIPVGFRLPTRLAFCRYLAAYINGFHEHMPFLHIPTMSVDTCSIELLLALAAIGAQYTFEGERGVELFNVSRAIATHRIRRRDARVGEIHRKADSDRASSHGPGVTSVLHSPVHVPSTVGPLGLPTGADDSPAGEDLMQTAQALLLLMALCTWAKHKEILREALAIQSVLATLIRDDGLESEPVRHELSWEEWLRRETIKRTKFIVYGFSNLHCIVYNIPPFILTSEVKLMLPCSAAEFKASTEAAWWEARRCAAPEIDFQDALQKLFSKNGRDVTERNSSSGNYALIHALIQHIFFVRQVVHCRFDGSRELSQDDVVSLENALRNWQIGWKNNPESSLDPMSPNGPVAFNSTALLRLAYIRLYVDTAGRALETRDPMLIANAFRAGPAIRRSPKITRAVLHSAHALSIPVKIGYRLVAKTQSFIWSIQHSLCTLECAYLMSKWLEALSTPSPEPPVTEDERRITAIVKSMLDETEFALPPEIIVDSPAYIKYLSAGVLRVWATIFKGAQTWAIVDVIGSALNLYADMLESG
ncbi:hypothetical protein BU23DRAFT_589973 [Bimuria novae-zelandiae CBS 107.79]|uniref:C2H2-type domain-containing protein n=1 Tax=Bimuria novae-zelandiae CBS 107.79 TaxID=1447943 RepID=A0A6A5V7S7_9PLEO|nr:hypothetical protein BU23DRAFT_589973 [Bimuria novae-zelandiae CBS 107.79]